MTDLTSIDARLLATQAMRRYANNHIGRMQAGYLTEYTVDNAERLGIINTAQISTTVAHGALTLTISVRDTANARRLATGITIDILDNVRDNLITNRDVPTHLAAAAVIQTFGQVTATLVVPVGA